MIEFFKYHGAGNDFIMIDNRDSVFQGNKIDLAKKVCSRRFGVGSDGLIFIENWESGDFEMDFYNPDGSQSFCGNGSRCAVAFAIKLGIVSKHALFLAIDGEHNAKIEENTISISMSDLHLFEKNDDHYVIHTGSPHYISFHMNIEELDLLDFAHGIRYSQKYLKEGINVNVIEEITDRKIGIRTYERGVEAETLACGTGATAAALAFAIENSLESGRIEVKAKGGDLSVDFNKAEEAYEEIWLNGPAVEVFKGVFNV
ncbi:MAG: diaminopimelate epimerase [Crocinitomix sp. MedPE-SWsnd]|nr:MAG: diaminopimelate epimerase [Crocinitomix sp. MedPE-SWsnd]